MADTKYIIDVADVAADYYLATQRNGSDIDEVAEGLTREDFIAGFEAAEKRYESIVDTWEADKEFVIRQLVQCYNIATRESEFYSASVIKTTLHKLGYHV